MAPLYMLEDKHSNKTLGTCRKNNIARATSNGKAIRCNLRVHIIWLQYITTWKSLKINLLRLVKCAVHAKGKEPLPPSTSAQSCCLQHSPHLLWECHLPLFGFVCQNTVLVLHLRFLPCWSTNGSHVRVSNDGFYIYISFFVQVAVERELQVNDKVIPKSCLALIGTLRPM